MVNAEFKEASQSHPFTEDAGVLRVSVRVSAESLEADTSVSPVKDQNSSWHTHRCQLSRDENGQTGPTAVIIIASDNKLYTYLKYTLFQNSNYPIFTMIQFTLQLQICLSSPLSPPQIPGPSSYPAHMTPDSVTMKDLPE